MSRNLMVGAGALALLLFAGWFGWIRQPEDIRVRSDDAIRVVGDTRMTDQVQAAGPANVPASRVAATPDAGKDMETHIPEDAGIRASAPDPLSDPEALYKRIRSEPRDRDWATRSENAIKAALIPVPYLDRAKDVRVSCATTLCEVHGSLAEEASMDNQNVAMQALQGDRFHNALTSGGLTIMTSSYTGNGKTTGFTFYAKRR